MWDRFPTGRIASSREERHMQGDVSATVSVTYRPIGIVHSSFTQMTGTPIQGVFAPDSEGVVEVFDEFAEGLTDVEMFSHIYLLYVFDRAEGFSLTCVPFLDSRPHGVFAVRAPRRPNAIGLSIVRVLAREKNMIRVAEIDVLDGTPLLDIKPYVPQFDIRPDALSGWVKHPDPKTTGKGADDRFGS